jgi:protease YdgD
MGAPAAEDNSASSLSTVDVSVYPWSSIGKLNNSVGGACTAAVVEQDKVLTAAHCIFNRRTNHFLLPSSLHILLGYERGEYALHALVGSYTVGPGYDPAREAATLRSDWVVLNLIEPLPSKIRPLQLVDQIPPQGSSLMIGSYARDRLHLMTVDKCQLLATLPGTPLLWHSCQVGLGSSGAPLLMMKGEAAIIVGIQVVIGRRRDGAAVPLAVSAPSIAVSR